MSHPNLLYLETFLAVVEAKGFGKAGEHLGISQPAVSYRVSRLEEQLGRQVFEKPRRRVILTPTGRALYAFSARFMAELGVLATEISTGDGERGPLRIACPGAFGRNVVFPALALPEFGDLRVELLFRPLAAIFDLVESGAVDLGIAYDTRVTNTLEYRHIADEEFCLISPTGQEPSSGSTLEELCKTPFVTYEECNYVFGKWFQDVYGQRPQRLETASSFSRLEEVIATVSAGRGYSIVPEHAVRLKVARDELRLFRPSGRPTSLNPEYAVTRPGWQPRPEVELLLNEIRRAAAVP